MCLEMGLRSLMRFVISELRVNTHTCCIGGKGTWGSSVLHREGGSSTCGGGDSSDIVARKHSVHLQRHTPHMSPVLQICSLSRFGQEVLFGANLCLCWWWADGRRSYNTFGGWWLCEVLTSKMRCCLIISLRQDVPHLLVTHKDVVAHKTSS